MADEYKIPIVVTADTEGAKETKEALAEVADTAKTVADAGKETGAALSDGLEQAAEAAKEAERQTVASAKEAAEAQKQAAREAAREAEELNREQIREARELAKELIKAAEAREREAKSEARTLDGFVRSGASQSKAAAWAEEATRVFGDFGAKAHDASAESGKLESALAGLAVPAAAVVGVFSSVRSALSASLEEYGMMERYVAKLDAALANQGMLTDEYRLKLQGLAGDLENATTVGAEHWIAALTRLTQFGADSTNIDELADGVKNLAGIMGGDVDGASRKLALALQGQTSPLGEYGIKVDEAASKAEKLASVLEQAARLGAGQLESQARSLEGQAAALGNAWGAIKEGVGNLAAPAAKAFYSILAEGLNAVASILPGTIGKISTLTNKQRELKTATDQTTQSVEAQRAGFAGAARQAEALANAYDRARKAQQGDTQRANEMTDAKLARDEAKVEAEQRAGRITPEQAAVAKENLRGRADKEKYERDRKAKQDEIASRTQETNRLEKDAMDAAGRAKASGNADDQAEADRLSQQFVEKARENADAIEQLKKDLEQDRQLFALRQQTRRTQATGEILGMRREKKEAGKTTADEKTAAERADAQAEAQSIGKDAAKLKGPSPEVTARLQSAAQSLQDGASTEELQSLNGALDKLATALERKGKGEEARLYREMQQRVTRLEGVVQRLESQQGGSGS